MESPNEQMENPNQDPAFQMEFSNEIEIFHLKSKLNFLGAAMEEVFDRLHKEEDRTHLLSTAVAHLMLKNELYEKMFERV
jgi:hypothetical protein